MAPLGGSGQRLPGSASSVVLAVPAQWFWQCQLSGLGSAWFKLDRGGGLL